MVRFANPAALWLLILLIPLILLYLLKHKRRDVVVPSTLLWKKALEDLRAQTPFQRLRSNLLLFLQIWIILLLTAILSQPYLPTGFLQKERWILVIDVSASMKATDVKPDRFTAARDQLLELLESIPPPHDVMLLSFASGTSVLQSFTSDHRAIRARLNELQPVDVGNQWQPLSAILQPLLKEKPQPRIVIASDFANLPVSFSRQLEFQPLAVGRSGANVGITRAVLRPVPEDPTTQILFYQLQNFNDHTSLVDVELTVDEDLIDAYSVSLEREQPYERSTEITLQAPAKILIRIRPDDILSQDNDFLLFAEPAQTVMVRTDIQNTFLKKALGALPFLQVSNAATIRITADTEPDSPGIYFLPGNSSNSAAEAIQWDDTHPALRYADVGLWRFSRPSVLAVPPGADLLIETVHGPIAYAQETQGMRKIVLGFTLEESNLFLLAGFPIFLQNSIQWIHEGVKRPLPTTTSSDFPKEGILRDGARQGHANYADPQESNIEPQVPTVRHAGQAYSATGRKDLSAWFLLLLSAFLIVEWWAFHKRLSVEG